MADEKSFCVYGGGDELNESNDSMDQDKSMDQQERWRDSASVDKTDKW